ncbi:MAG: tRNA pseudouridine(65) synthase TruC [Bacteroidales bacterium]|nr:tRNA pseudouridine(65) synthase TruC [Bacteroidales bacterium]
MSNIELEIILEDEHYIAINKPAGLLVHRTSLATESKEFALQILRNQINRHVYPCHRLDRKTSGALLFAKSTEANRKMQKCFAENEVAKTYLAIVRGFTEDTGIIDYPLKTDNGKFQEAITHYKTLAKTEVNLPFGKHSTSRYSLVEVKPQTGRMHQIRKHFAHILHPIIGDRPHGCNKQNKLFKERWNMSTMLLHSSSLEFTHPFSGESINIQAPLSPEFTRMLKELNLP